MVSWDHLVSFVAKERFVLITIYTIRNIPVKEYCEVWQKKKMAEQGGGGFTNANAISY